MPFYRERALKNKRQNVIPRKKYGGFHMAEEKTDTEEQPEEKTDTEQVKPETKPNEISNKERRKMYADAVNQFKDSDEFQQMITAAVSKGEEQATMTEQQKAEQERKEREAKEAADRQAFEQEKAAFHTSQALQEQKLPTALTDYLTGKKRFTGTDDDVAVLTGLRKLIDQEVQDEVLKRASGKKTPTTGSASSATVTAADFKKMGLAERTQLFQEDPETYKALVSQL